MWWRLQKRGNGHCSVSRIFTTVYCNLTMGRFICKYVKILLKCVTNQAWHKSFLRSRFKVLCRAFYSSPKWEIFSATRTECVYSYWKLSSKKWILIFFQLSLCYLHSIPLLNTPLYFGLVPNRIQTFIQSLPLQYMGLVLNPLPKSDWHQFSPNKTLKRNV